MDDVWLTTRKEAFAGCRAKFNELVDRARDMAAATGTIEWGPRAEDSVDFVTFGRSYRLRHQFDAEDRITTIQLLAKETTGNEHYALASSIEMDQNGNLRPVDGNGWPWSVHNHAVDRFFELVFPVFPEKPRAHR